MGPLIDDTVLPNGFPVTDETEPVFHDWYLRFGQLFRAHPRVAQGVRCLRLEGGLGKDLVHVAKQTTGLRCLYVDLQIKSAHSITGLRKALPLLKLRVEGERGEAEQCEERKESPDAVDCRKEDEGAAGIA